jgi:hypothetical protein
MIDRLLEEFEYQTTNLFLNIIDKCSSHNNRLEKIT